MKRKPIPRVETDYILNGMMVHMCDLAKWFDEGQDEHYVVRAIRKHLLTPEQRDELTKLDLEVADILNGRVTADKKPITDRMMRVWNLKLDAPVFGWSKEDARKQLEADKAAQA